jgi:rhodanese-related sulfurtransferase
MCHGAPRRGRTQFTNTTMSKRTRNGKKQAPKADQQRTTTLVAVGTFLAFSLIAFVAWAMTRPPAPAVPVAAAAMGDHHGHNHGEFEVITASELKALLDRDEAVVIDVRSMQQYFAGHIPGSLHIPVPRIEGEIPYLPKGKLVVTYCTCPAEESSGEAVLILEARGVKAKALVGGLDAWTQLGYATATRVQ